MSGNPDFWGVVYRKYHASSLSYMYSVWIITPIRRRLTRINWEMGVSESSMVQWCIVGVGSNRSTRQSECNDVLEYIRCLCLFSRWQTTYAYWTCYDDSNINWGKTVGKVFRIRLRKKQIHFSFEERIVLHNFDNYCALVWSYTAHLKPNPIPKTTEKWVNLRKSMKPPK